MEQKKASKGNRKFKAFELYDQSSTTYFLLPFRFFRITHTREVLVNEVGDFLIVPTGTAQKIIEKRLERENELYGDLIANFFISESKIPPLIDIVATRYRTKKSFLDDFTSLHIFVVSLRCEHTCHYCQVSRVTQNKTAYDMKAEHIDKGIELMMQSPNPNLIMEFQGGEPLLAFDKVKYAVEKAQKQALTYQKNITYVICTNLAVINDEILSFCKANNILISTSLDGPAFVHNPNRPRSGHNSYELVIGGIERCREVLGFDQVSALMTTTAHSLQYPIEIIDEYRKQKFNSIFLRSISPYGFALKNDKKNKYHTDQFLHFYKIGLNYILELNKNGEFFVEEYTRIILSKILSPFPVGYVDLQSPSGAINSAIVFNYDGKVYASDESRMLAEQKDDTFCLGDMAYDSYNDIFYGEKAKKLSLVWANEGLAGCSDCAFLPYCGADPVYHYATQGDAYGYRPTSGYCQKNMEIFRYLFQLMDEDKDAERIFRTWISYKNG